VVIESFLRAVWQSKIGQPETVVIGAAAGILQVSEGDEITARAKVREQIQFIQSSVTVWPVSPGGVARSAQHRTTLASAARVEGVYEARGDRAAGRGSPTAVDQIGIVRRVK